MLKEGSRWRIGTSHNFNVLNEPWLCDSKTLTLQTSQSPLAPNLVVSDLFAVGVKAWNGELVRELFSPCEAEKILATPLVDVVSEDKHIWNLRKDRLYSVKSCYRSCMDTLTDLSSLKLEGDWLMIWKLNVPPKVKSFARRACRDVVPSRINLQMYGVSCPSICIICGHDLEMQCHILLQCANSREVWVLAGFWHIIKPLFSQVNSYTELFFLVCGLLDSTKRAFFVMILWSIWKAQNQMLWKDDNMSA